jgi:molybdopterin converting factor small subunit
LTRGRVDRQAATDYEADMHVTVKCFATLSRHMPPDADAHPVEQGETARSLMERLGIPERELKLVFLNGSHVSLDAPLADGDRVGFFPAVGGG